ncbi:flagellar protein FliT [Oxalobacteraceae bacterium R-40]|uniref:Flagellar protein FliT n=1 Tax=Keguizhuia sedimenti TaxID=3064264 RepID=A0ABU1BPD3_9BURK|nr:flagellar protein FliT [Oxalobacteraceae bacterium R-40]
MIDNDNILEVYENVAAITTRMLAAARTGDWEQLAELESQCSSQVAALRKFDSPTALTGPDRDKKVEIIRKILSDDQQIRSITEPWMKQLATMMQSTGTERKLSQAYGSNSGA